jgi:hypothetical protein
MTASVQARTRSRARIALTVGAIVAMLAGLAFVPALYYAAEEYGLDNPYLATRVSIDGGLVAFVFRADSATLAGNTN